MEFQYRIADCDVRESERPRLERFRKRLTTWHEWLFGDEHSIWNQIHQMLWNDMLYWTINECRRLAEVSPSPNVGFNGDVAVFIDQSYVANQLLAIRKLTERNERQDAITLFRVLDDMKANADLFTRELYVCNDGLPFDPEPVRKRVMEERFAQARKNGGGVVGWGATTGPNAYASSIRAHKSFDRLTNFQGKERTRGDSLSPDLFDHVKSKLGLCGTVNKVASKFIAHAAEAASRGELDKLSERERKITFARLEACHRMICRVATYICGPIMYYGGTTLVPIPQYGHLEHLDKGWLASENFDTINTYWNDRTEKIERWVEGDWDKLLNV